MPTFSEVKQHARKDLVALVMADLVAADGYLIRRMQEHDLTPPEMRTYVQDIERILDLVRNQIKPEGAQ